MMSSPATAEPASETEPPARPRREEFFIHPEILLGSAVYRPVDREAAPGPPEDPGVSGIGRR